MSTFGAEVDGLFRALVAAIAPYLHPAIRVTSSAAVFCEIAA